MTAPEVPDWTRPVSVMGKDSEGNPVTVLLDSLGRLICVLYGAITLSGPIDVTQVDSTREIQGADGVTLHTIAVDSEGRIIAIVKGEYAGTLKNLAVDSEGRMIMIPTDPADIWGNAISMGNAELVARLTGLGGFDRRGNVVFADGFEHGLSPYEITEGGVASKITLSSEYAQRGGWSCKFGLAAEVGNIVYLSHYSSHKVLGRLGVEVSFTIDDNLNYFHILFTYYDGTYCRDGQIRYLPSTDKWQVWHGGTTWVDFLTSWKYLADPHAFHTLKLVVDQTTRKYTRALIGSQEVDLSAYTLEYALSGLAPHLVTQIRAVGDDTHAATIYIDSVIITQNEPA